VDFGVVETNLRDSFRILAAHHPNGEVREYPGVSIASTGVTFQMFNAAFLSAFVANEEELERRVSLAEVHFRARFLDWACWICEDWLDERVRGRVRHVFRKHNLRLSVEMPGMVCPRLKPAARCLPALDFRRVGDELTRNDFCAIGSACFNVPLPWFREVFSGKTVWGDFAGYVGYLDGEAICTAATVVGAGVVGVYNVATLPGYQRRGYGEAVMRHALDRAREQTGLTRTILQSTAQGLPLYCRMGYEIVTRVAVYAS